jgi:hypothetical protein
MTPLQNILDLYQFSALLTERKASYLSIPWWNDCINQVELQVLTDRTTSRDNLREKAKSYANNYIAMHTEVSFLQKDQFLEGIADEIEKAFQDLTFDQRPPASVVAQKARSSLPEHPEERFIKLGK